MDPVLILFISQVQFVRHVLAASIFRTRFIFYSSAVPIFCYAFSNAGTFFLDILAVTKLPRKGLNRKFPFHWTMNEQ